MDDVFAIATWYIVKRIHSKHTALFRKRIINLYFLTYFHFTVARIVVVGSSVDSRAH